MTAIYDLTRQNVYFAYGYISPENKKINAYDRPHIKLNLKEVFGWKYTDS